MSSSLGVSPSSNESLARLSRLQQYLEQDPDNLNLLAEVADLALQCGELDLSRTAVQQALVLQPDNPFFALRLSSVALAEGNGEEALAITAALRHVGQDDPAIRFNQAQALVACSRYEEAKELLQGLVDEEAPFPLALRLLLRAHHYLGEVDEAIALAQSYLEVHPEAADVAGMLSLLYFDHNDFSAAAAWSQRALAQVPDNLDALLAAGGSALGAEDTAAAKMALLRAISVQPRSGRAWGNLGLVELLEFNLEAARDKLEQAVKYMPEHIGTWHVLGWTQLLQGHVDEAERSFRQTLEIDDAFGDTYGGLAAVEASRGHWEQAEHYAKMARRLDPESMSPYYAQILRLQQEEDAAATQRLVEAALKRGQAPAGGSLYEMLGRTIGKGGQR